MSSNIAVYADWVGLAAPTRIGWLYARRAAGREVFEFAFEPSALAKSCGLRVPTSLGRRFASEHHTFLVQRFDRTPQGRLVSSSMSVKPTTRSIWNWPDRSQPFSECRRSRQTRSSCAANTW